MPMRPFRDMKNGFTLIELLVVISIIGFLASVVLASLSSARTKSINATIQSEVTSRITAINLLLSNTNGLYPSVGDTNTHCFGNGSVICTFAATAGNENNTSGAGTGASVYSVEALSQIAGVGPPPATPQYLNNYIGPASYNRGLVVIGSTPLSYSVGIFYRCATTANSGADCVAADIYWTQTGTSVCQKGSVKDSGNGNVLCWIGADGNTPTP